MKPISFRLEFAKILFSLSYLCVLCVELNFNAEIAETDAEFAE